MKEKALTLIQAESKVWLCNKLGITRPTLDKRLINDDWKKSEAHLLLILSRFRR